MSLLMVIMHALSEARSNEEKVSSSTTDAALIRSTNKKVFMRLEDPDETLGMDPVAASHESSISSDPARTS